MEKALTGFVLAETNTANFTLATGSKTKSMDKEYTFIKTAAATTALGKTRSAMGKG